MGFLSTSCLNNSVEIKERNWGLKQYKIQISDKSEMEGLFLPIEEPMAFVVLIHGFNRFGAWEMLWRSRQLVQEGYAVLLPSQIGFGESRGPKDYCGPATVQGVHSLVQEVIDKNPKLADVPVILWGASRGAIVGGLLVGIHPDFYAAGVLQAGAYDFKADIEWEHKNPDIKQNMIDESGGTDEAYTQRSALQYASAITTPLLIMHGMQDDTIDYKQSEEFAHALNGEKELVLLEHAGHRISSPVEVRDYVLPFLAKYKK